MGRLRIAARRAGLWVADRAAASEWVDGHDEDDRTTRYYRRPLKFEDIDKVMALIAEIETDMRQVKLQCGGQVQSRLDAGAITTRAALEELASGGRWGRHTLVLSIVDIAQSAVEATVHFRRSRVSGEGMGAVTMYAGTGTTRGTMRRYCDLISDHTDPLTWLERRTGVGVINLGTSKDTEQRRYERRLSVKSAAIGGSFGIVAASIGPISKLIASFG